MNRSLLAYVLVVVGLVAGMYLYTHGQTTALREGLVRSCERVNVLRAQSNVSDLAVWRVLSSAAQREHTLSKTGPVAERPTHADSAKKTAKFASDITITALTNCDRAIDDPQHYKTILAGPIGDPATGREDPEVRQIERESRALASRARP